MNRNPVETMAALSSIVHHATGEPAQFFIQYGSDGWGAGVGRYFDTVADHRDADTLDEAIDGVAQRLLSETWERINSFQQTDRNLRFADTALGRLGYR